MHGEELEQTRDRTFDPLFFLVVLEHDFLTPSLETPTWSLGSPHAHRSSLDTEPLRRKSPLWQEHQGLLGSTTKVGTELGQARDPLLLGRLALCNPWTVTCQAPLSMGFSRQEYWGGLPFPSPGTAKWVHIDSYNIWKQILTILFCFIIPQIYQYLLAE